MHAKTWIYDRRFVITGSPNMTRQGMNDNKEHAIWTSQRDTVDDFASDFLETFDTATEVTQEDIDDTMARWRERRSRSSANRRTNTRRSLSDEFDEGYEHADTRDMLDSDVAHEVCEMDR